MKVEIGRKNENAALERAEIEFTVSESKVTPKRKDLRGKIAALLGSKEEQIIVDRLEQSFGSTEIRGTARIYKDAGKLKEIEREYLIARNEGRKLKKEKAPAKEEAPPKEGEKKDEGPAKEAGKEKGDKQAGEKGAAPEKGKAEEKGAAEKGEGKKE